MRGIILAIAPDGTDGQLTAEDGKSYSYWTSEISNGRGKVGQSVPMLLAAFFTGASFFVTGFGVAWLPAELLWGLTLIVWIVQMELVYLHVGRLGPNEYGPDRLAGA